jgi:HK97 family phage portal protein
MTQDTSDKSTNMEKNTTWFQRNILRRKPEKRGIIDDYNSFFGLNFGTSSTAISTALQMQLSAVYRCVEVISDSMAAMPIDIMRFSDNMGWSVDRGHKANYMLNIEPNPSMSRFTFIKTLVAKMLLDGNGFAKITRDKSGNPLRVDLITEQVTIYRRDDGTLFYKIKFADDRDDEIVDGTAMLHTPNFSYDGLVGVSTLTHAALSTGIAYASEKQARGFFSGGANLSGILKVDGRLDKTKAQSLKDAWKEAFDTDDGDPGGIAVIESGTDFQATRVNPKEAQMLESRQFSVVEICRFFGVSPTKAFDTNAASYNSVEAGQLAFLTDTIQPIVSKIECELNRKLFRPSERASLRVRFDTNELLRTDSDSQANYMMKMFQIGAYTSNEIRERIGNQRVEGGDTPYIQVNMQPLTTKTVEDEGDTKSESESVRSKGKTRK